jgi:DnaA family protein
MHCQKCAAIAGHSLFIHRCTDAKKAMQEAPRQFPLPLRFDRSATFTNYWVGANEHIVAQLNSLITQAQTRWIYLAGAPASGVSHLLQATMAQASELGQSAIYISLSEMFSLADERPEITALDLMESIENYELICIDNIDALTARGDWQEALFYLLIKLQGLHVSRIVFGAQESASFIDIALADLRSRLAGAESFQLKPHSDEDKALIVQHHAQLRGCEINDELASFIVQRYSRDLPSLVAAVDLLDQNSMSESRKLTIPFAKKVLLL